MNDRKLSPFERYRDYVIKLEQAGKKFPTNQFGDINLTKIADECGNRRQWFSENAKKVVCPKGNTLEEFIANDLSRIGSEFIAPKHPESSLADLVGAKSREANRLRVLLEQKSNENALLRDHLAQLTTEVRQLRANAVEISSQHELMIDSGRTFTL